VEQNQQMFDQVAREQGMSSDPGMLKIWKSMTDGAFSEGKLGWSYYLVVISTLIILGCSISFFSMKKKRKDCWKG